MNTDRLRQAYADFLAAARSEPAVAAGDGSWSPKMVLAHVVVGDRLIAEAAACVMAGLPTSYNNLASQSVPYLQSVVEAVGGWSGLLASVQQTGAELVALAEQLTEEQAATPILVKIVSDNAVVIDATVPLSNLILAPSDVHLRMHTHQLLGDAEVVDRQSTTATSIG